MRAIFSFPMWFAVSLVWTLGVFYIAMAGMPQVPLDMSPNDPATAEAFRAATTRHLVMFGLLGAVPPALLLGLVFLAQRGR